MTASNLLLAGRTWLNTTTKLSKVSLNDRFQQMKSICPNRLLLVWWVEWAALSIWTVGISWALLRTRKKTSWESWKNPIKFSKLKLLVEGSFLICPECLRSRSSSSRRRDRGWNSSIRDIKLSSPTTPWWLRTRLKTRRGTFRTIRIRYHRRSTFRAQTTILSRTIPNIRVEQGRSALMLIKLFITIMEVRINKICLSKTKASFRLGINSC